MIDWTKPILIGGMHRTFRLSGQLNKCPLVVTVDGPQSVETLYVVAEDGSSKILNYDQRGPVAGPKFENEPPVRVRAIRYVNVYNNGNSFSHETRELANANSRTREASSNVRRIACVCVEFTVQESTSNDPAVSNSLIINSRISHA